MFKKLWLAISNLIGNIQNLAETFKEADDKARLKFGLKERVVSPPELEHKPTPKVGKKEKVKNG